MPRAKQPEATTPVESEVAPQVYTLEPLNDDTRSRLNVLGNSMQLTIQQLQPQAPGWAEFLTDVFETIGMAMQVHE